jgi:cytoskeletal protein CcmA (bactofilin family)
LNWRSLWFHKRKGYAIQNEEIWHCQNKKVGLIEDKMAISKKTDQSAAISASATIIAAGTKINGELQVDSMVYVYGEFSGTINSKSIVSVGKTGLIEGDVVSNKLIVNGRFVGTAHCEEIEISAGGKLTGQIISSVLVVERGSFFEGESKLKGSVKGSADTPAGDSEVVANNGKLEETVLEKPS